MRQCHVEGVFQQRFFRETYLEISPVEQWRDVVVPKIELGLHFSRARCTLHHHGNQQLEGRFDVARFVFHREHRIDCAQMGSQYLARHVACHGFVFGQVIGGSHQYALECGEDEIGL